MLHNLEPKSSRVLAQVLDELVFGRNVLGRPRPFGQSLGRRPAAPARPPPHVVRRGRRRGSEMTGASIAKRQVEQLAIRAAQDFDAFYELRAAGRDPGDDLLIISTDGKGIAMRHEDLARERGAQPESGRKLETRLTPGEKSNRKRMAQVATVYSIAPFPRGPADIIHSLRKPTGSIRSVLVRRTSAYGRAWRSRRVRSFARPSPRRSVGSAEGAPVGRARRRRTRARA